MKLQKKFCLYFMKKVLENRDDLHYFVNGYTNESNIENVTTETTSHYTKEKCVDNENLVTRNCYLRRYYCCCFCIVV